MIPAQDVLRCAIWLAWGLGAVVICWIIWGYVT